MKILTINASPVKNSSTEIILARIIEGIESSFDGSIDNYSLYLNEYIIKPCQACGESPEPDWCIYHDDIYPAFDHLAESDIVLFGSPVYFDTVSAQAKLFIDRTNCFRPVDFETGKFQRRITKTRHGAMVLVGSERQQIECARKVIAGFFKWVNIENMGHIDFTGTGLKAGSAANDENILKQAFEMGQALLSKYLEK